MIPKHWPPCPEYRPQSGDLQATWAEHLRACEAWQTECFRVAIERGDLDFDSAVFGPDEDGRDSFTVYLKGER